MRNHLPVGAIRQQQLWNLGKERAVTGVRGKGEEREGGAGGRNRDISTREEHPPQIQTRLPVSTLIPKTLS